MYHIAAIALILNLCLLLNSCETSTAQVQNRKIEQNEESQAAYAFLETFLTASPSVQQQLSKALRPSKADLEAIFIDTAVQNKALIHVEDLFNKKKFTIQLRKEHQVLEVWSASIQDFQKEREVIMAFPSDFLKILPYCNESLTFHRFKFKIKGYESGLSYSGLIHINGRWIIIPRIWEIIEDTES